VQSHEDEHGFLESVYQTNVLQWRSYNPCFYFNTKTSLRLNIRLTTPIFPGMSIYPCFPQIQKQTSRAKQL
jgi:hypothetical protein